MASTAIVGNYLLYIEIETDTAKCTYIVIEEAIVAAKAVVA